MRTPSRFPTLLFALFWASATVRAQAPPSAPPPRVSERAFVDRVEVRGAPDPAAERAVRAAFGISPGDPVSGPAIRAGIRRVFLGATLDSVDVYRRDEGAGVVLTVQVTPARVVGEIDVKTSGRIPLGAIRSALQVGPGARFDDDAAVAVQRDALEACRVLGYPDAQVDVAADEPTSGRVRLVITIVEGRARTLRHLIITGDERVSRADIVDRLGFDEGARLDTLTRDAGLVSLRDALTARRHLRARVEVKNQDVRAREDGGFTLELEVTAGPRYRVGFVHNQVVVSGELREVVNLSTIGALNDLSLEVNKKALREFFFQRGFPMAKVYTDDVAAFGPYKENADRVLRFIVREGRRAIVEDVRVEGAVARDAAAIRDDVLDFANDSVLSEGLLGAVDGEALRPLLSEPAGEKKDSTRPLGLSEAGLPYVHKTFERARNRIRDAYRSEGFLDVEVKGPELFWIDQGRRCIVRYRIVEDQQLTVSGVRFAPPPTLAIEKLLPASTFAPGEPVDLYAVEETRARLLYTLKAEGFYFADVIETLRQSGPGTVEVVFALDEGPRVRVGDIVIRGNEHTQDFVIADRLAFAREDWFTTARIEQSRRQLLATGLFSAVRIALLPGGRYQSVRDVIVEVTERNLFAIEAGIGASIEDGPRMFLGGEARNVLGLGIRTTGRGQINYPALFYPLVYLDEDPNHPRYRAEAALPDFPYAYYVEGQAVASAELAQVYGVPFPARVHVEAVGLREIRPAFTLLRGSALAGLDTRVFRWWSGAMEIEGELSDFDCPREFQVGQSCGQGAVGLTRRRDNGFIRQTTYRLKSALDFRDDPFAPTSGVLLSASAEVALGSGVLRDDIDPSAAESVNSDFFKGVATAAGYLPLGERIVIASRLQVGAIVPVFSSNNYIPLYKRFYLGGTRSVRGYVEDEILPADDPRWPTSQPEPQPGFGFLKEARNSLGGNLVSTWRTELRVKLIGELQGASFFDVGQLVQNPVNYGFTGFAAGTGFGLRYNTPVGPFAVDLGYRVANGRRELPSVLSLERFNVHFSIGAF